MTDFTSKWRIGQKVFVDGDHTIKATITAVQFRTSREPIVELSWVHSGIIQCVWLEEWMVTDAEAPA